MRQAIDADLLHEAVDRLRAGELVVFPTETVYGLGADAANPAAIARVYALKGRPENHPLIVHLGADVPLENYARNLPPAARALAAAFWPGPLTLVLERGPGLADAVTGGQATVALRKPAHPVAGALLKAFGGALAAPSANRYGRISPTTAAHVHAEFGSATPLVLDGGPCSVGLESTIVGWVDGELTLLRPGQLGAREIEAVAGAPLSLPTAAAPRVSGSDASHYAPRTPARFDTRLDALGAAEGRAVLARRPPPAEFAGVLWIHAAATAADYARDLYAHLRQLDESGAEEILIEPVPDEDAWDAVRDRLGRATKR